jgi:hypothetical protein
MKRSPKLMSSRAQVNFEHLPPDVQNTILRLRACPDHDRSDPDERLQFSQFESREKHADHE